MTSGYDSINLRGEAKKQPQFKFDPDLQGLPRTQNKSNLLQEVLLDTHVALHLSLDVEIEK